MRPTSERPPSGPRVWDARGNRPRLARGHLLVLVLVCCLLAACTTSLPPRASVPPPVLPAPRILAIADAGRASLSQVMQMAADPAAGRAYLLAGHQIFGPAVSAPWADSVVGVDRDTGATLWHFGTSNASTSDHQAHLSGIVANPATHQVFLASGSSFLALDGATGAVAVTVSLPPGTDCVSYPAPLQPPTLDAQGRAVFRCNTISDTQPHAVGVLVDFAARTASVVAPPPAPNPPPEPAHGILGHLYVVTGQGLRVEALGPKEGPSTVAELPFNVSGFSSRLFVELDADGSPTGRLYLAGIGGQVAILQDAAPAALAGQTGSLWATVLAERAVALTVATSRFASADALPTLPGFLVAPGRMAFTYCFGEAKPDADGSVTTSTAATPESDGSTLVQLSLIVRGPQGEETGSRSWTVSVAANGQATILSDQGSVDPFKPLPSVPCPV
jgi:hypothetical protein